MRSPTSDELSNQSGHDTDHASAQRATAMPDIACSVPQTVGSRLDRVGMGGIEMAVRQPGPDGQEHLVPARADATVSLDDPETKGIHMSRLFLALEERLDSERIAFPCLPTCSAPSLPDNVASPMTRNSRSVLVDPPSCPGI